MTRRRVSPKRIFVAALLFALAGWIFIASLSVWNALNSMPDLTSLGSPAVLNEAAPIVATTNSPSFAQAEVPEYLPDQIHLSTLAADAHLEVPDHGILGTFLGDIAAPVIESPLSSLQSRCDWFNVSGYYVGETEVDPDFLRNLSLADFEAVAESRQDDGHLQLLYAERLENVLREGIRGEFVPTYGESFETMKEYYIRAVRSHNAIAAGQLANLYYSSDRIESRAWWRIAEEMGIDGLARIRGLEADLYTFTAQETDEGIERAEELMIEFKLASGLGKPEECLTADEVMTQRRHLAMLLRRLAQRAMPSEASDASPRVFNSLNGVDLVVENVCSLDCPRDTQRLIYYSEDPGRLDCAQVDGVALQMLVRSATGSFQEKTFCVPTLLVEN